MIDPAALGKTDGDAQQGGKEAAGAVEQTAFPLGATAPFGDGVQPGSKSWSVFFPDEHGKRLAIEEFGLGMENVRRRVIGPPNRAVFVGYQVTVGREVEQLLKVGAFRFDDVMGPG